MEVCQRGDNLQSVSLCVHMAVSMQPSPICALLLLHISACICDSRGEIGGPENVRNVEECNQNVLLCGKQQQQKKPREISEYCSQ